MRAGCMNDNDIMTSAHPAMTGLELVACGSGRVLETEELCFKEIKVITWTDVCFFLHPTQLYSKETLHSIAKAPLSLDVNKWDIYTDQIM